LQPAGGGGGGGGKYSPFVARVIARLGRPAFRPSRLISSRFRRSTTTPRETAKRHWEERENKDGRKAPCVVAFSTEEYRGSRDARGFSREGAGEKRSRNEEKRRRVGKRETLFLLNSQRRQIRTSATILSRAEMEQVFFPITWITSASSASPHGVPRRSRATRARHRESSKTERDAGIVTRQSFDRRHETIDHDISVPSREREPLSETSPPI